MTIDKTRLPSKPGQLPLFTPVPRAKDRHNGWKPEVQRAFIEALAETGSVKSAARRVGRAEVSAYLLRRHPEAHEFRQAWDIALDIGMRRIEDVAMDPRSTGSRPRSIPTASWSAPAVSITITC